MSALKTFTARLHKAWGPLTSELILECRDALGGLLRAYPGEPWLADIRRDRPAGREICRDARHGYVLLAHAEQQGFYRPPHDHGRSWVIYAVLEGEIEMGGYGRVPEPDGRDRLVRRDLTPLCAGEVRAYLPGDVHDTRCIAPALLLRLTERDLRADSEAGHGITRFIDGGGFWTEGSAP